MMKYAYNLRVYFVLAVYEKIQPARTVQADRADCIFFSMYRKQFRCVSGYQNNNGSGFFRYFRTILYSPESEHLPFSHFHHAFRIFLSLSE